MESGVRAEGSATSEGGRTRAEFTVKVPSLNGFLEDVFGEEFVGHMRAAQKEQLLAVRSLIDRAVEKIDQADTGGRSRRRVEIEVD